MHLAHVDTALAQSAPSPDGEEAVLEYIPCLVGAAGDDRLAYELGSMYRPMGYAFLGVGIIDLLVMATIARRLPPTARTALLVSGLFFASLGTAMAVHTAQFPPFVESSTHEHADLAVVVDGTPLDLSQERFMSKEGQVLSNVVHLHNDDGRIIHKHALGVTYGYFFHTIGLQMDGRCMVQPDGSRRCDQEDGPRWTALVNGEEEPNLRDREIRDLDRVLLWYGPEDADAVRARFDDAVSDDACIASGACPERGAPPLEDCG